jgi:hypothetical protein
VVGTCKRATLDYGGKFPHVSAYFYIFFELYNLYSSPNIRMNTYRRISCARHVAQLGETQCTEKNLNGNHLGDLSTEMKLILMWVFKNQGVIICIGFKQLRRGLHTFSKRLQAIAKF